MSQVDLMPMMFGPCIAQSPLLLVWLVGFGWAIKSWQKHPKVSLLVLIALIILAGEAIISSILSIFLPMQLMGSITTSEMGALLMAKGIISVLIHTLAWVMILYAIFGWREDKE